MLLFIQDGRRTGRQSTQFQYISCYCLSLFCKVHGRIRIYFNTSHVTVYLLSLPCVYSSTHISIHLMLLFIGWQQSIRNDSKKFQYISCYCLSFLLHSESDSFLISIHLMLLFIHKRNLFPRNRQEFQYISCYCLSAVAVPCIAVGPDFNTSHVTVYLQATNYQTACDLFQYISCYCLSMSLCRLMSP